jgi:hypothetical protein
MLEKLLSLLLHAKGGAVATVLVLGASGALVTATVENGMTTVTLTQPSTTTTGSQTTTDGSTTTNNTVTQQILALFNRTSAEDDPSGTATGKGCSDEAHDRNVEMKRVDATYKTDHAAVLALSKDAPKTEANRQLVKDADKALKDLRRIAVKAIHETFKSADCKGNDDEDEDEVEDDEDGSTTGTTTGTTNGTTSATTTVAISGTDAKAIADLAIAEMDKVVEDLKAKLAASTTATTTTEKAKPDNKSTKNSGKGKGHSEGRSHNNEDDD